MAPSKGERAAQGTALRKELAREKAKHAATAEVLRIIRASPTDLQPVAQAIVDAARRLCGCTWVGLFRFDGQMLHWIAARGASLEQEEVLRAFWPRPADRETVPGRAILARATVHVRDAAADVQPVTTPRHRAALGLRTILGVPMLRDGQPIGVIGLIRAKVQPFSKWEIALVQTFADQAVIAIENARLFSEVTSALDRQTATAEVLRTISQAQADVQPVFEAIADSAMRLFGAWSASVFRYDGRRIYLVATRGGLPGSARPLLEQLQTPQSPVEGRPEGRAVLTRTVQHIADAETDPAWSSAFRADADRRGFRSLIAVPMLRGHDVVGVVAVSRDRVGGFGSAEVALLQTFADQAVIAIENARLLTELQARNADLGEALEQQTATSEVLRVISRSPTDIQPVLQAVTSSAARLCEAQDVSVFRREGDRLLLVAHHGPIGIAAVGRTNGAGAADPPHPRCPGGDAGVPRRRSVRSPVRSPSAAERAVDERRTGDRRDQPPSRRARAVQ
jgi:two-component system NtrC family sensor kinase